MGAMRPLIAIAPPNGAIGELLRETGAGEAVRQSDIEGQAKLIERVYNDWLAASAGGSASGFRMDPNIIVQYERREATRKLASLLDDVTSQKSR
jgi:hypothetical protein